MFDFKQRLCCGLLAACLAPAQGLSQEQVILTTPQSGVDTYATPPGGLLSWQKGAQAPTDPDARYIVDGVRQSPAGFGGIQTWIEVRPADAANSDNGSRWLQYIDGQVDLQLLQQDGAHAPLSVQQLLRQMEGARS